MGKYVLAPMSQCSGEGGAAHIRESLKAAAATPSTRRRGSSVERKRSRNTGERVYDMIRRAR
eukprot:7158605-Prymnesium_polylepis.1